MVAIQYSNNAIIVLMGSSSTKPNYLHRNSFINWTRHISLKLEYFCQILAKDTQNKDDNIHRSSANNSLKSLKFQNRKERQNQSNNTEIWSKG